MITVYESHFEHVLNIILLLQRIKSEAVGLILNVENRICVVKHLVIVHVYFATYGFQMLLIEITAIPKSLNGAVIVFEANFLELDVAFFLINVVFYLVVAWALELIFS